MAKNLNEYYTAKGQALPDINTRAKLYESAGLGSASDYIAQNKAGNAAPNTTLLAYLTKQAPGTVNVVTDTASPNGTRKVTYDNGQSDTVRSTKNADGSETYSPIDTPAGAFKDLLPPAAPNPYIGATEDALGSMAKQDADIVYDEKKIKDDTLAAFQAEIDAQNAIYAEKLARAKVEGANRIGQTTAIAARRGLLGSDMGSGMHNTTVAGNEEIYGSIEAEKQAKIASILSKVRDTASAEIKAKREAKQKGLNDYLSYLAKSADRKKANAQTIAQALIDQGIGFDEVKPDVLAQAAKDAGLTVEDIKREFEPLKKLADEKATQKKYEEEKRAQEIDKMKLSRDEFEFNKKKFGLEYALKQQELALKSGGGATSGTYKEGENPTADAWVNRILGGQAKLSDITGNPGLKNIVVQGMNAKTGGKLSIVQQNLKDAKRIVDTLITHKGLPAITGMPNLLTNPFGLSLPNTEARDAKALIEQLDALLFLNAVPQMKGMGQLTEREGAKLTASQSKIRETGVKEDTYKQELQRLSDQLGSSLGTLGSDEQQATGASTTGTVKERAVQAGYDYDKMISEGYTEQQIEAALNGSQ